MNSKVKAQFFAQYLGQEIFNRNGIGEVEIYSPHSCANEYGGYLLLRSIDSLADEELDTMAVLYMGDKDFQQLSEDGRKYYRKEILPALKDGVEAGLIRNEIYQYLLRIGILLPFTYLNENNKPITLTTQQIIDAGWTKYQTP